MLRYAGFSASPVSVDSEGMQPEKLERALNQGARAVILTPRAHNPTGCSLSARRAAALQNMLARYPQVVVIIDDHFALLSSSPAAGYCADNATLGGDTLRFQNPRPRFTSCYCRQRQRDLGKLRLRLNAGSQWVSHLLQDLVYACLTDPEYQHRLTQTRLFYAARQQNWPAPYSNMASPFLPATA